MTTTTTTTTRGTDVLHSTPHHLHPRVKSSKVPTFTNTTWVTLRLVHLTAALAFLLSHLEALRETSAGAHPSTMGIVDRGGCRWSTFGRGGVKIFGAFWDFFEFRSFFFVLGGQRVGCLTEKVITSFWWFCFRPDGIMEWWDMFQTCAWWTEIRWYLRQLRLVRNILEHYWGTSKRWCWAILHHRFTINGVVFGKRNIMRVGGHMRNEKHLGCNSANEGVIYLHTFPGD